MDLLMIKSYFSNEFIFFYFFTIDVIAVAVILLGFIGGLQIILDRCEGRHKLYAFYPSILIFSFAMAVFQTLYHIRQ